MAENYTVEATVKRIGDMEQVHYTNKDGKPAVFTKFEVECLVGQENITYESAGWNKEKLAVGSKYSLEVQDKGQYTDSIKTITFMEAGASPEPASPKAEAIPEYMPTDTPRKRSLIPDFGTRFREYNTHARLAAMQATDRVKIYCDLMKDGKLVNSEGIKPDGLTIGTIQGWISNEIDRYWDEYYVRVPRDIIGEWEE